MRTHNPGIALLWFMVFLCISADKPQLTGLLQQKLPVSPLPHAIHIQQETCQGPMIPILHTNTQNSQKTSSTATSKRNITRNTTRHNATLCNTEQSTKQADKPPTLAQSTLPARGLLNIQTAHFPVQGAAVQTQHGCGPAVSATAAVKGGQNLLPFINRRGIINKRHPAVLARAH